MGQVTLLNRVSVLSLRLIVPILLVVVAGCSDSGRHQKQYRVGILSGMKYLADTADSFRDQMKTLGYVDGKSISYDIRYTDFDMAVYQRVLKKFVAERVDLIFVYPTEASMEAKAAAKDTGIPVVFSIANVEDTDLVESIRSPGKDITGVRYPGPDIAVKRLEIMRRLAPEARRFLIPYQKGYPIVASQLEALQTQMRAEGLDMIEAPASDGKELEAALETLSQSDPRPVDAILFLAEPLTVNRDAFRVMGKFATVHRIPIGGALISVDGYESLFGLNVKDDSVGKQAAFLADKILKGTPAGSIPVVSAEPYFQLNYRAAKAQGFTVSEGLLSTAHDIIK